MLAEPEGELHFQQAATEVAASHSVRKVADVSEEEDVTSHASSSIVMYAGDWDFRQVNP